MQTQTLLGLFPQIKNMEDNIVSMIMELSTKLANLTDANIFVLVEVPNQRKFSGSQHLVDQYLTGGLAPIATDIELQVSITPTVFPKVSFPHHEPGLQTFSPESTLLPQTNNNDKKRRGAENTQNPLPKRKKLENLLTEKAMIDTSSNPCVKAEQFCENEVDLTLDEDSLYNTDTSGQNDDTFFNTHRDGATSYSDISLQHRNSSFWNCLGQLETTRYEIHRYRFIDTENMLVHMDDLNLPSQKIEFLQSIQDTEKLFVKGSPETKIVTSLMYDFGKSLHAAFTQYVSASAAKDPLSLVKPFINTNLDAFLQLFPNLRLEHFKDIRIENRKPKAFLRQYTKNSFSRCMRESFKNISNINSDSHPNSFPADANLMERNDSLLETCE